MIQSMTGFANKAFLITSLSGEKSTVSINLKTLNSRFFETTIKLPLGLSYLETTLIKQFKKKLYRGHVYFTMNLSNPNIFEGLVSPAFNVIDGYVKAIEAIKQRHEFTEPIKLNNILRLPNIFSKEEQPLDQESTSDILDVISELIEKVIQDRLAEGQNLLNDLQNRINTIKKEMSQITDRADVFIEESKKKILNTLQGIGADDNLIVNAQKNGLYAMLDKIDIHEEITRLTSHLDHLIVHVNSNAIEKGKRLDFTLQELGREINTIAAKCSDATISSHAINVKVEIEKMREQIQNIV